MKRWGAILVAVAVVGLTVLGLVMLASTSYFLEEAGAEDYAKFRQHLIWLAVALVSGGIASVVDHQRLYRLRWWILGVTVVALALCFTPWLGERVNGAARWITLKRLGAAFLHLQPSEFAKLTCAIVLAGWFTRQEPLTREFKGGFVIPSLIIALLTGLIAMEVDLGSAAIVACVGGGIMFVAGTRPLYLLSLAGLAVASLVSAVKLMPNRMERIMAFLDLEKYKDGLGLQQWRALLAFGSGGLTGIGLGDGRMKQGFLPEPHTDFIFPMIGEEFGFVGTALVVALFCALISGGLWIAHHAADRFGKLLAFGIVLMLGLEALLNMGVTTALLPNKGLALPFISYGGSSMVAAMIGIGILFNIHHHAPRGRKSQPAPSVRRIIADGV